MWIIKKKEGTVIGRAGIEYYDSEMKAENQITGIYRAAPEECNEYCHLLGYVIGVEYQNKGYGFEACRAIIDYGINTLELKEIKVNIDRDNIKSIRLAKKIGFLFWYVKEY